jgi:D-xylose transport system substrate-binding protein
MRWFALVAITALASVTAACGGSDSTTTSATDTAATPTDTGTAPAAGGTIGFILPDSKSSIRWESFDRPMVEAALKAAGYTADIQNAEGDKTKMATIADQMITSGVKVLMIVNLDSPSAAAIETKADAAGIPTIDYDRLTLGGSAKAYISFDNEAVGVLQGEGLVKCLADKGVAKPRFVELNGSPTDNNATLFKKGYDSVLDPKVANDGWVKVDDQSVPDWDNQKGGQIFEQMLTKANGKIDGVLAANDGLGGAAIAQLKKNNLQIPVTGQDATPAGLQAILAGDQCMTVYKAVKVQAQAAADAAVALATGGTPATDGKTVRDDTGGRDVPAVLATPVAIYKDNVKDVIADGFVKKEDVCTADLAQACTDAGIS